LICWDCGKEGHARNKCPGHFKFKPKSAGGGGDGQSVAPAPPAAEEGNENGKQ
jgi:hypothetical protein